MDCFNLSRKAIAHVREYSQASNSPVLHNSHVLHNLIMNNFTNHESPFLFTASIWNKEVSKAGVGFCVLNLNSSLLLAGCCSVDVDSELKANVKAFFLALRCINGTKVAIKHVFTANNQLQDVLENNVEEIVMLSSTQI